MLPLKNGVEIFSYFFANAHFRTEEHDGSQSVCFFCRCVLLLSTKLLYRFAVTNHRSSQAHPGFDLSSFELFFSSTVCATVASTYSVFFLNVLVRTLGQLTLFHSL